MPSDAARDPASPGDPIRRALISLSDKTGLVELGKALAGAGVEILSTGGSAKALAEAGIPVVEVADYTGFPEIMDGRVKTLQPKIHGGILARRDKDDHIAAMKDHEIGRIDLVAINLYPFEETVAKGADFDTAIENIDIGGPALIRAAAKNHAFVTVLVDPADYAVLADEMAAHGGATSLEFRTRLAAKAYARTGAYDAAIARWFAAQTGDDAPERAVIGGTRRQIMRYGENPHQSAAFYTDGTNRPGVATAKQVQGKELSYNNINDADAAFELVAEFDRPSVAIIKHANPCGVATADSIADAHAKALACDPVSAFGGIVALNRPLDGAAAEAIVQVFSEVIIAPDANEDARRIVAGKKNLRLLLTGGMPDPSEGGWTFRSVAGGFLLQGRDASVTAGDLKIVTKRMPTKGEVADMVFAFTVAKHVKSNAIVYAKDRATVGIGAGQMSRVDSARIAVRKAQDSADAAGLKGNPVKGSVVASDAFYPFPDGLLAAVEAGATAAIQPGGSVRDEEVIAAADEHDIAMVFTGQRHFRH
jgi:phosphoribosylaminoimidazolecarboxamide formyltransferase/IMP cyclohydrolase